MRALLLDTCAVLWVGNGERMSEKARQEVDHAAAAEAVYVSPISAWEIATLVRKNRLALSMAPDVWFEAMLGLPGVKLAPMPPRTLIASALLPGRPPNDPADRIIAATARAENMLLLTRDARLLSYAEAGHVRGMAC